MAITRKVASGRRSQTVNTIETAAVCVCLKIAGHNRPRGGHPMDREHEVGWLTMETQAVWRLFAETGLPEAYALYCLLRRAEEERERADKTA